MLIGKAINVISYSASNKAEQCDAIISVKISKLDEDRESVCLALKKF